MPAGAAVALLVRYKYKHNAGRGATTGSIASTNKSERVPWLRTVNMPSLDAVTGNESHGLTGSTRGPVTAPAATPASHSSGATSRGSVAPPASFNALTREAAEHDGGQGGTGSGSQAASRASEAPRPHTGTTAASGAAVDASSHVHAARSTVANAVLQMQGELQAELHESQLQIHSVVGRGGFGTVYHGMPP